MQETVPIRYFLGANTASGFYSLYEEFIDPSDGDFTWFIKGGPGNGKSTFMRRAAEAAEEAGYQVEYALCSGDPDSLDGIYIPALKLGYVDATSPHVQEPPLFGAAGKYLDLSAFYKKTAKWDAQGIAEYFRLYREQYARAYDYFTAAKYTDPGRIPGLLTRREHDAAREAALSLLEKLPDGPGHKQKRRFLSANTCQGTVVFPELAYRTGDLYVVSGAAQLRNTFLQTAAEVCRTKGQPVILCPDPLDPALLEGVLLPEAGISLLTAYKDVKHTVKPRRVLRLDAAIPAETVRALREESKKSAMLCAGLMQQAEGCLKKAKQYHDALEALYHPTVDFAALDRFCKKHVKETIPTI